MVQKPYYAVYGWMPAAGTDPALVPGPATMWQVESGTALAPGQPVTLRWDNGAGQIFRRIYELDDKFLFTVTQSVENTGTAPFSAAPYGILARHGKPDTQNFFVLHEGVVGMTDGKLLEQKYKDMPELAAVAGEGPAELISVQENGWIGFTDKYWMTTLGAGAGPVLYRGGEIRPRHRYLPDRDAHAGVRPAARRDRDHGQLICSPVPRSGKPSMAIRKPPASTVSSIRSTGAGSSS